MHKAQLRDKAIHVLFCMLDSMTSIATRLHTLKSLIVLESGMLPRQKRRGGGGAGQAANKVTNAVYHKLTEVVETMAILTETQPLTDITVLLVIIVHNCKMAEVIQCRCVLN